MPRPATKVKMVKAKTFVLDPKKKYLVAFSRKDMTIEQGQHLLETLFEMEITAVGVALYEGNEVKVIELPKENENV